jgi:uncharacterized protein YecE (DUF72 family)
VSRAYIGCSGWNYKHWREILYPRELPASRWLEHYAQHFDTVEVNATFYRLPTLQATARWTETTPPGFVFAIKASRYLTHVKRLREISTGWGRFEPLIEPIAKTEKLGPILWQLPENFHRDDERLANALAALPRSRHCFEFRHASWFVSEIEDILRDADAALVIGVDPGRPFQTLSRTTSWTYIRFHRGRGREGNFIDRQLEEWAERVRTWLREGNVYAYFNDDWGGHAIHEALRFRSLLEAG